MLKPGTKKSPTARAARQAPSATDKSLEAKAASGHPLSPDPHPELVFGIVGPIGVDLEPVISVLCRELLAVGYTTCPIQLSRQIESFFGSDHRHETEDKRISNLMDEGTRLRSESGWGDAVAWLGIAEIRRIRTEELDGRASRNAFILRSLKHPKEVETLRSVYGKGFFLISVYSPREVRVTALAERISRSNFGKGKKARAIAEGMVERDEEEESTSLGQDVRDAFPLADLFVDSRNKSALAQQISRFFELLFGNVFHTPSRDEQGMHYARSAALRSADLNRQVGAAILRVEGDLIAVGCNDVPKAGGDLYWPGDKGDARDFQKGVDAMADERLQVLGELLERFETNKLLSDDIEAAKLNGLVRGLISGERKAVLRGTRVMGLLEFGRSVHAEMAALMSAARLGISVKDATLFCTTFPCHMCARHIVASGIKRVVYVEPYPKSKAKPLHGDSISVDPSVPSIDLVNFEPFEGIAPRQYQDIFDAGELRKDPEGKAVDWRGRGGMPRFFRFQNTYLDIETAIVSKEIPRLLIALKISMPKV